MRGGWGSPELWTRARDGDAAAFAELVRELSSPLRGFLFRMAAFREDVDDLCQEVLARLVEALPRLRDPERARSFVLGIALRVRQERRRRADDGAPLPELESPEASPLQLAVGAELRERTRAALAALPESLREVLVPVVYEQLEPAQVAELLDLSPGAVRHRLFRARQAMREMLEVDRDAVDGARSGGDRR